MSKQIVTARERTVYDIIEEFSGERVGVHEDKGVASLEAERLDREAGGQGQQNTHRHVVRPREVMATDDPDDGLPMIDGPIVSSETVTTRSLRRAERPLILP